MGLQKKLNYGEERRFVDDISEMDIELQKQTQAVSAVEMMEELDKIKSQLQQREIPEKEQE